MDNLVTYPTPGLMDHQYEVLKDPTRFKCLIWHRRARKTSTALEKVALEAHSPHAKNKVYWVVFPTYAEAKEAVWKDPNMLFRVIPKTLIKRQNEVELTIYLHSGSVISLKGADHPDTLRGAGPQGIIFDEYATMKPEAWGIMQPVIRANHGWAWFIGTPKGKNHLYDTYLKEKDSKEWKSWLLKSSSSGIIDPEQLMEAKKDMSDALFNQEFECDFHEGEGSVFRHVREVCIAEPQKPIPNHTYTMGVDLAKHQDWTVISVFDRGNNCQVFQDRFQKLDWPFQKKRIATIAKHYNNALVYMDATGLGDPIVDDLLRIGVAIEPVKFTNVSKKELIENLSMNIENKRIQLLNIEESLLEDDNFGYTMGPTGRVQYQAIAGHDDIVISHSLGVSDLQPLYKRVKSKPLSRIQKHREGVKNKDEEIEEAEWREWYNLESY